MNDIKISKLISATTPFILLRIGAYFLFMILSLIVVGIVFGIIVLLWNMVPDAGIIGFLVSLGAIIGTLKIIAVLREYTIYIVKSGHIAVITKLVTDGEIDGSQTKYAFDKVKSRFGSTTVAAGINALIHRAVKQIMGWVMRAEDFLSFIPGANVVLNVINAILSIAGNYIDESVLSYIYLKEQQNPWKSASDGLVLYFQNWKSVLKTSAVIAITVIIIKVALIAIFFGAATLIAGLLFKGSSLVFWITLIIAFILASAIQGAILDPIITLFMIRTYHKAIVGQTPSVDLYEKAQKISAGFRKIIDKSKEQTNTAM